MEKNKPYKKGVAVIFRYPFFSENLLVFLLTHAIIFRQSVISLRDLSVQCGFVSILCVLKILFCFFLNVINCLTYLNSPSTKGAKLSAYRKLYDYLKLFTDKLAVDTIWRVTAKDSYLFFLSLHYKSKNQIIQW